MKQALLLMLLLACGCGLNPRTTAPVYEEPASREQAARFLNEALAQGSHGISEINATTRSLTWHERRTLSNTRTVWVPRELTLTEVRAVQRPEPESAGWRLAVEAAGGRVVFRFKDSRNAAKAESAFERLRKDE